ncbi:MAG: PorV/PorQ family protein [Ignavibacteriales bacterium]|nr:PorV/PorQ family protein [Ignavibacteriales bacterium]
MKRITQYGMLLAGWLCGLTISQAQIVKKAQVGFRFLENPVSAEVVGRGGVGVATTLNSMGIFWNPALISWGEQTIDVTLHHTQWIADISYEAASGTVRIGDVGVVGMSMLWMDYGVFHGTQRAPNTEGFIETGNFTPYAYAVGISFSQKVSDRFSYGVHIKHATQDLRYASVAPTGTTIDDPNLSVTRRKYKEGEFAADIGAYYDFLYNGIKFGATLQNISREVRYENNPFPLPFAVSFGATVEPLRFFLEEGTHETLILSFESRHPRDFKEKLKLGAEFMFLERFTLRSGYATNYDERGFSAGVGVRHELEGFPLRFDYAFQPFGIFGTVHHFSLGVSY